jgi:PadR family transcriptional regulator, regulatory protein PadR
VVSPSLTPKKASGRVKTDRRDADQLARLFRAGELTAIHIPDQEDEAIRDLMRARYAAMDDQRKARNRLHLAIINLPAQRALLLSQGGGFLINFISLLFDDRHRSPTQALSGFDRRPFGVASVQGDHVKKARAAGSPNSPEHAHRSSSLLFAGTNSFAVELREFLQRLIEFGRWRSAETFPLTFDGRRCNFFQSNTDGTIMQENELLKGTLDMLILKVLSRGSAHGFGIAQRIQQLSEDVFSVGEGSLYPALHRLQEQGWIESEWGQSENNRRARYYRLTKSGRKQLDVATQSWNRLCVAIRQVMHSA